MYTLDSDDRGSRLDDGVAGATTAVNVVHAAGAAAARVAGSAQPEDGLSHLRADGRTAGWLRHSAIAWPGYVRTDTQRNGSADRRRDWGDDLAAARRSALRHRTRPGIQ